LIAAFREVGNALDKLAGHCLNRRALMSFGGDVGFVLCGGHQPIKL
jgi:hypothetical protein